jgi:pseudouridine synthase
MLIRLNKYLSQAGLASRREADRLIREGRVRINGRVAEELGIKVDDVKDRVDVDGRAAKIRSNPVYVLLNKPKGCLVTLRDPFGRRTVRDLLAGLKARVFPVGRLDADSRGLLLLTDDGELAFRLSHPRFEIPKKYVVAIEGGIDSGALARIGKGLLIEGVKTAPARVRVISQRPGQSVLSLEIHEGRKREIRKMMDAVGCKVIDLKRTGFAGLSLGNLKPGEWRYLEKNEAKSLRRRAGLG